MSGRVLTYRPPMSSDSEDDDCADFKIYDNINIKKVTPSYFGKSVDQNLLDAVKEGDLAAVKDQIELLNFDINKPLNDGLTLLMHACNEGHIEIVYYLVKEVEAEINLEVNLNTAFKYACNCSKQPTEVVEKIVDLLLLYDTAINTSDIFGVTPFMMACKNGHVAVVRRLIKDVSFEAKDNQGCTPIFYAIEYNRPEILKILIDAGMNTNITNKKGYTPVETIESYGFHDLLEILPKDKEDDSYITPPQFLSYVNLRDYIPRIFLKTECPEYFQEILFILQSLNLENLVGKFAQSRISLAEFLSITNERLIEIGIDYPLNRMQIMKGILNFHLYHWGRSSIANVLKGHKKNFSFNDAVLMTANHLIHLIIIASSIRYIRQQTENNLLGPIDEEKLEIMKFNVEKYSNAIVDLTNTTKYLASFSPPMNPLYIEYDINTVEKKNPKLKYLKYTTIIIGISIFVCFKFKKFLIWDI